METEPTVKSAIKHYLDGKGVVLTQHQGEVWMDAFRGYDPWTLLEAARSALKFERGPADIQKLQTHYQREKAKNRQPESATRETFSDLDLGQAQYDRLRQVLREAQTPEEAEERAFGYARQIGVTRRTNCDG